MRNPAKTLQISIFEPLFSSEEEELHPQIHQPLFSPSSNQWPTQSLSPLSSSHKTFTFSNNMRRAPATMFNDHISEKVNTTERTCDRESITCDRPTHGMHSSANSDSTSTISTTRPSRSLSSSDVDNYDDGSIASKLLTSITKSISSPSLLACCKESARESPYQKTLKLRRMKLQHCAEELGSESCDGSSGENSIFDSLSSMSSFDSFSEVYQKSDGNASSMMISVRSSPNLRCPSLVSKHTTHSKERLFPPPLSHTLRKSASSDSFSYSLRAYREDGRFLLKEVKVPCRQYFQANRKDGRLTLQVFSSDEDFESKQNEGASKECQDSRDFQEGKSVVMYQGAVGVPPADNAEEVGQSSCNNIKVESTNSTVNLGGACRLKESQEIDHVGMNQINEQITSTIDTSDVEKGGCLSAKSLLIMAAAFNGDSCGGKDVNSQGNASTMRNSGFKAAKCKTEKVSRMFLSNNSLSSSSWKEQALLHPPGESPTLKLSHHIDVTSTSQCEQNMILQGNSTTGGTSNGGGKISLQRFEIASVSLQGPAGYSVGKTLSSTIKFKEVSVPKCLMKEVTKLVSSFGLDGGKWCGRKMTKSRELDRSSSDDGGVIKSSMYTGMKSINIGVRKIANGPLKANGVHVDVECEHEPRSGAVEDSRDHSSVPRGCPNSSSFHFDIVQIPSSTYIQAALQANGWLQTLHCKELFDRSHLAKGFMKLHCVAIRS